MKKIVFNNKVIEEQKPLQSKGNFIFVDNKGDTHFINTRYQNTLEIYNKRIIDKQIEKEILKIIDQEIESLFKVKNK